MNTFDAWNEMEKERKQRKQNAPCPEWISVKERLPERCGYYLVFTNNFGANSILVSKYADYGTFKSWCVKTTVTHWMPLPEPPKEGDNVK